MASRKRAADGESVPAKRTRFVSPDEDPARFEESVEDALETSMRKGAVRTEGYESDSTDDGEGVVYSRHKKEEEGADDEDMFGLDDNDSKAKSSGPSGSAKKKAEYLQLGDIEGQEFNRNEDDESASSLDEADALDQDDAERIRRAKARGYDDKSMGFELSSFNMKEEMAEGKFLADGSYTRARDPLEMHDRWLDGTDDRAIKRARRAHKARLKREAELQRQEDVAVRKEERERDLVCLMRPSESVLEALQRLGAQKRSGKTRKKNKNSMAVDSAAKTKVELDIEKITELASALMVDNLDIYSVTYEELLRSVRRSKIVDDDWRPPEDKYEYRWKGGDGETFGPFSLVEMTAWRDAEYFGSGAEKIELRKAGGEDWGAWEDVI